MKTSATKNKDCKDIPILKIKMVQEGSHTYDGMSVTNPTLANIILKGFFKELDREMFVVLCLNSHKKPVGINIVSIGNPVATFVMPREVFKPAILSNATSIIVAHNHPSGNLEPSKGDLRVTRELGKAGKCLGITLHDHLIIGLDGNFTCLRDRHEELFN